MPDEPLEDLVSNHGMREPLSVVFERSDGGAEELHWADLEDALSTDEWDRLIEREVVIEGRDGFELADPEAVAQVLNPESGSDFDSDLPEVEPVSWAWYDKAAAVGSCLFFVGYTNAGVRNTVASVDNIVLHPLTEIFPFYLVILVLAALTGLYSSVLQSRLMDHERMERYQSRIQEIQDRREAAKESDDEEALQEIQDGATKDQLGMFKLLFRPMVWTMLLTLPIFLWIRWKIRGGHLAVGQNGLVVPLAGAVGWQDPLLGPMPAWIVWYVLGSIALRQVIKKVLGLQTSPS